MGKIRGFSDFNVTFIIAHRLHANYDSRHTWTCRYVTLWNVWSGALLMITLCRCETYCPFAVSVCSKCRVWVQYGFVIVKYFWIFLLIRVVFCTLCLNFSVLKGLLKRDWPVALTWLKLLIKWLLSPVQILLAWFCTSAVKWSTLLIKYAISLTLCQ